MQILSFVPTVWEARKRLPNRGQNEYFHSLRIIYKIICKVCNSNLKSDCIT